jgi:hypothetical protein
VCISPSQTHNQKPFKLQKQLVFVQEILTMGGLTFLIVNGSFTFFLLRFTEKIFDPVYEEKIFKKSLWNKS